MTAYGFYCISTDGKMYPFLFFFGARVSWATFLEIIPGLTYLIPDYVRVNSPLALLRELTGKQFILLIVFVARITVIVEKSAKFPVRRE
jgi:hypothetical protein